MVIKQLAVKIPLPKDPRRKQLADGIEWTILFLVGFFEEAWRWMIVRFLVAVAGGDGGYGTGPWAKVVNSEPASLLIDTPNNPDKIWKEVYFMGWVWCLFEAGFAWWSYRPHQYDEHKHHNHQRQDHVHNHRGDGSFTGSPGRTSLPNSRDGLRPLNGHDGVNFFSDPFRFQDGDGSRSGFKAGMSVREPPELKSTRHRRNRDGHQSLGVSSHLSPTTGNFNHDLESGHRGVHHEDDEFGDAEDDDSCSSFSDSETSSIRSSSETARSRSATPLLSSSLPYDPNSEHPHHEQQSLLQYQYRRMSYNTLSEPVPAPCDSSINEDDAPNTETVFRDYGVVDGSGAAERSPLRPRAYPSYPSYSVSYNHSYFAASPAYRIRPSNFLGPLSLANDNLSPRQQPRQQPQQPQRQKSNKLPTHHYLRKIYGVDTNLLNIWLPILWRLGGLLRGLGHVMLFSWFPNLFYKGQFQFWTLLMLLFVAGMKGWYTVEWVGGSVARSGITKVTVFTTAIHIVTYLLGLRLWGVIH
ncbi:hypothetical protein BDZ91DRAFT_790136 [Kalaharituber pfeilii]|nr:hypothetical protein BDZ91DRAFT_790136 [Kalaharituber pfeilii]